ncbi:MAG: FtsX-like permease family protein [Cytophagales bacterium]|nr:FtsX-like permease family protein [Cytophagales bacterium]
MNISLFIAKRYFLSRKKKNFINVISTISMLVVGIATMALIIVLSVFNGLEGLLRSIYSDFDPEIRITATEGRSFVFTDSLSQAIYDVEGVAIVTEVIEDNVLIKYDDAQRVVRMKGVSDNFLQQNRLDRTQVSGELVLVYNNVGYAIVGKGIQLDLNINPSDEFRTIQVYYPRDIGPGVVNPERLTTVRHILPGGIFSVEKHYDDNYMLVPLAFAQDLLRYGNKRNALEIKVDELKNLPETKKRLSDALGNQYTVQTNDEIHEDLYKVLKIEKFFVFVTFSLIIGIASINIYFALMMLAIDKQKDISILAAQGADASLIRKIFLWEGGLVALVGAFVGLTLGVSISYIQQEFGIISMGMQTAIMEAYPVKVEWFDVMTTCICVVLITFLASFQPARLAARKISLRAL